MLHCPYFRGVSGWYDYTSDTDDGGKESESRELKGSKRKAKKQKRQLQEASRALQEELMNIEVGFVDTSSQLELAERVI